MTATPPAGLAETGCVSSGMVDKVDLGSIPCFSGAERQVPGLGLRKRHLPSSLHWQRDSQRGGRKLWSLGQGLQWYGDLAMRCL